MQSINNEVLTKLKELRNLSNDCQRKLETNGLPITDLPKAQLFDCNIKDIVSAVEALLRNEPSERPELRLQKGIPDSYINIDKVKKTNPGKLCSVELDRIKELIQYIEGIYKQL